jgi:hypothetical protein
MDIVDRRIDLIWIRLREAPGSVVPPLASSQVLFMESTDSRLYRLQVMVQQKDF